MGYINIVNKALRIMMQKGPTTLFAIIYGKLKLRYQYKKYLSEIEKLPKSKEEVKTIRNSIKAFAFMPTISIIVPVYNTDKKWLIRCIESVINQVYEKFELCMSDGGSSMPHVKDVLEDYMKKDKRIKVNFLTRNMGIAGNSNEALSLASGEFIALLDHDDELSPYALYEVAKLLNEKPDLDFIYSDEDKITTKGKRIVPHFKPAWSPDYLLTTNYVCHFTVIRSSVIDSVGGFRQGYDGSQDHDLFLRAAEYTTKIARIPKILYHWRVIPQSAASDIEAKPYAREAGKRALIDAMNRRDLKATVSDGYVPGTFRIQYSLDSSVKISIIISSYSDIKSLTRCIRSVIQETSYVNYEVLIVDKREKINDIHLHHEIESYHRVRLQEYNESSNQSKISNYALSVTDSEYVIFLDSNAEIISPEWITALLEHTQRSGIGVAGPCLCYPDNTIRNAGIIVGVNGCAGFSHHYLSKKGQGYFYRSKLILNVSAVSKECMMLKRSVFNQVGGFDESYQVSLSDIDLCLKILEKSYLIVYTPYSELYYHKDLINKGDTSAAEDQMLIKDTAYFHEKWADFLAKGDPYYNPNLTLNKEDYSLRIN